ncbi:MAG: CPBP family intramembrane metalloprotease [Oscillospiraceae bacterium]|nr:CPBP family intramembrane metalloprotease [Oscillospiraceae bacterium]
MLEQYFYVGALTVFGLGVMIWIPYRAARRRGDPMADGPDVCAGFRPADGLAFFCANMIVFLLTAPYLQNAYGLWGLLLTELLLLTPALLMPVLTRVPPGRFFRLSRPSARHTAGGLFLWMGALLGAGVGTSLLLMLFPGLAGGTDYMQGFVRSGDMAARLLCLVLAPAVCEELFHRGVILASFRGRFNDSFIVVVMGLIFGVFHFDPARFISATVLGMALTYAALRARSVLLPMALHCINNLLSVGMDFMLESRGPPVAGTPALSAADEALLLLTGQGIFAFLALTFLTVGYFLLRDEKRPLRGRKNPIVLAAAAMALTLAAQAAVTLVQLA